MSVSRRRFLALSGGLAATAVGLTACGSNTGRPEPQSSGSSGGGAKPSLTQWYHEYGEDGVQKAVEGYAKAYDKAKITVKWNPGEYEKLVSSALLTDKVPDIFEYGNGPTLDMIKAGQVLDVTETLGSAKDEFSKPVLAPMIWQDKVWAIPQAVDMQMLYYRKSLLDKAGVQPPKTLDQLIDAAKAVKTKDMGGFFAGNDGGLGVLGALLIWSAGFEYLNDDKSGIGFADPAMYQGLVKFRDFHKSGGLLQSASADWSDPAALINGEAAMQWTGLWALPDIQKQLKDDIGVVPFPKIGGSGRQAVPIGAFSSCITAKGKDPAAAKEFIKWLWVDQEDKQLDFATSYGTHIPAKTKLASKTDKLSSGPGADAAKFVAELGHGPDLLWTPATAQAYTAALSNIVLKGADPKSEIAKVAATAKKEIQRAKS